MMTNKQKFSKGDIVVLKQSTSYDDYVAGDVGEVMGYERGDESDRDLMIEFKKNPGKMTYWGNGLPGHEYRNGDEQFELFVPKEAKVKKVYSLEVLTKDDRQTYQFSTDLDVAVAQRLVWDIGGKSIDSAKIKVKTTLDGITLDPIDADLIHLAIKHEQKVFAIKAIRAKTGLGLKEAKDVMESWYAEIHG